MASLAYDDDSAIQEYFLRRPPPPFDDDFAGSERKSNNADKDWLPELTDIISGNCHVMIDLTGDSDSKYDVGSSSRHPRSASGTVITTLCPTRLQPSSFGKRPPWVFQPPTADSLDWGQAEIPEIPDAIQGSPTASVQNPHRSDGDTEEHGSVEEQQEQQKEDQEREEDNSSGGFPPSRQPDAPSPVSITQLLEFGMVTELQSPEAVQDDHLQTQSTSRVVSPARQVPYSNSQSHISVQDITFLHVGGQRETSGEPEYLFVGKMWLRPGAGVPSDLPQIYRREVARKERLATLRTRKRMGEEVEAVQAPRGKKVKQAQSEGGVAAFLKQSRR